MPVRNPWQRSRERKRLSPTDTSCFHYVLTWDCTLQAQFNLAGTVKFDARRSQHVLIRCSCRDDGSTPSPTVGRTVYRSGPRPPAPRSRSAALRAPGLTPRVRPRRRPLGSADRCRPRRARAHVGTSARAAALGRSACGRPTRMIHETCATLPPGRLPVKLPVPRSLYVSFYLYT